MRASIVIVTWDGVKFLEPCLPTVLQVLETDGGGHEVIVVDNGSSDGSADFVAGRFPSVSVIRLEENVGAAGGYNAGALAAKGDVVVTLHHDVALEEGFLGPLLEHFRNEEVFAVTSKLLFAPPDGGRIPRGDAHVEQLHLYCHFRDGLFELDGQRVQPGLNLPDGAVPAATRVTWYAPICNGAYRRDRLLSLGGFAEGFGHLISAWYDVDVCYRAWKRGWSTIFEPASMAYHLRAHSWRGRGWQEAHAELMQGAFLFVWANLTDPELFDRHLAALPRVLFVDDAWVEPYRELLRLLIAPDVTPDAVQANLDRLLPLPSVSGAYLRGFMRAIPRLPAIAERRNRDRVHQKRGDRELLALLGT